MVIEREGMIQFAGKNATVIGPDVEVGDTAVEFTVQAQDWSAFQGLENTQGKVRIIAAVPSLDTAVCDRETRRFNEEAAALGEQVAIFVISADLPITQKRWCGAAGIDQVLVLSDHINVDFGTKYGCLLKEQRILRRAVFVVDQNGKVVYVEYTPTLGEEPNYEAVLRAARKALSG